jgi:predicted RNA-binding Zn-ribbon protein involved in translation (DUF1610 family)
MSKLEINFDAQPAEFACPSCGHKMKMTIGDITSKKPAKCEGCGITMTFDDKGNAEQSENE